MRTYCRFVIWTLLVSISMNRSAAQELGVKAVQRSYEDPATVISNLQSQQKKDGTSLVAQAEFDGLIHPDGGGACPSVLCVNLMQALRVMRGMDRHPNPHKAALLAFNSQPALLKGRLSNDQIVDLITYYQGYLDGSKLEVSVVSAPNSGYRTHKETWSETSGPDLMLRPLQLKVLSYTVTTSTGNVLGRHFVLLKGRAGDTIEVLDPAAPEKTFSYSLEFRASEKGERGHLFLKKPIAFQRANDNTLELNTLFTVSVAGSSSVGSVEFINQKIEETARELQGTEHFINPRAWRKRTASYGLPRLDLPADVGGASWPAVKMIEVFRHAGRYNLNFRDVVGGAHSRPLLNSKNAEVREIVRQVGEGNGYVAIVITEPDAGTDIPAIKSSAKKVEGGFLLSGTKRFNARLSQASHVVIFTQGTTGEKGKLSAFVIPIETPGLKIENLQAHGLTGNSYGGISFENLKVSESSLLGNDGEGMRIFFEHFLYWRLMQSAAAIGTGENALDQMADRIKKRQVFGGPIGRFTHLQQQIGQHKTELRMAMALAKEAAERIDQGDYGKETRAIICGIKAEGVEIALRATDAAARAFGGEGYSTLVDLGDRLRDLNGLRIADGTTDVMRMEVVRQTFGEEFWEMAVQPRQERGK